MLRRQLIRLKIHRLEKQIRRLRKRCNRQYSKEEIRQFVAAHSGPLPDKPLQALDDRPGRLTKLEYVLYPFQYVWFKLSLAYIRLKDDFIEYCLKRRLFGMQHTKAGQLIQIRMQLEADGLFKKNISNHDRQAIPPQADVRQEGHRQAGGQQVATQGRCDGRQPFQ